LFGIVALVAVGMGLWRWQTRGRRAVRALEKMGASLDWVDDAALVNTYEDPIPPEEQYYHVWILPEWRGGEKELSLLRFVPRLRKLSINRAEGVNDASLRVLPRIHGLRELTITDIPVSEAGLVYVSQASELEKVSLQYFNFTDAGLISLSRLRRLEHLCLNGSSLENANLKHLKNLPQLVSLHLAGTDVTDRVMRDLDPRLTMLSLSHTGITDEGLADLGHLRDLQWLYLSGTEVTDAGMPYLNELPKLLLVHLCHTQVTDAGVALLDRAQGAKPELTVRLSRNHPAPDDPPRPPVGASADPFGDSDSGSASDGTERVQSRQMNIARADREKTK
jgi:hypothetical protein